MTHTHFSDNPELLLSHADFVRALARSLLHDEHLADDVVQEAWMAALQEPRGSIKKVRAWLAGTVRNLSIKKLRTEGRKTRTARAADRPEPVRSPEEMVERETVRRRMVDAVSALDEPYRSVILFRYYDDMPPRRIARLLGIPVETVKTRIQRGLRRMRTQLDESYGGSRRTWCLALAPLAGLEVAAASATAAATTSIMTGALAMSMKTKVAIATGLTLLFGLTCTILFLDLEEDRRPPVLLDQAAFEPEEQSTLEEEPLADEAARLPLRLEDNLPRDAMPESFAKALGRISGRLVEEDGSPVPHTRVGIVGGDLFDILRDAGALFRGGPHDLALKEAATRTAEDGTFSFAGVFPRSFYVFWADAGGPRAYARLLDSPPDPGGTADLGDIVLPPYVTFRGRVVDESGEPVQGARIRATNLPPLVLMSGLQDFGRKGSFLVQSEKQDAGRVLDPPPVVHDLFDKLPIPTTRTANDGSFRLEGVPLGFALVIVDHDDFATLSGGPVATGRSGQKDIGDLVLLEGYTVRGVVTDHEGEPLSGIEVRAGSVRAFRELTVLQPPVRTDTQGAFRVGALGTDSAMVAVQRHATDKWTVIGPLFTEDEPAVIALPPANDLEIKVVTKSGIPVDGAQLKIGSDEVDPDLTLLDPPKVPTERMDQSAPGIFVVNDLPAGRYRYLVTAPGYAAVQKKVTIHEEPVEREVVLEPALEARLLVIDADGDPVEWAEVHAFMGSNDWNREQHRLSSCRTDAKGRGLLENLRRGKYTITVTHPGFALSFGVLDVPTEQEFLLIVDRGGSIEGVVYSLSEEWTPPYMIVLGRRNWRHAPGGESPRIAVTDKEGRFRVSHLTPAEWWVNVVPRLFARSPAELVGNLDFRSIGSTRAIVKRAETTYLELTLGESAADGTTIEETGSVSGRMFVDQIPAEGATVSIRSGVELSTTTGSDGEFLLPEVPCGTHTLLVSRKLGIGGTSHPSFVRTIEVEPARTVHVDLDIRTGSLSGRIVRSDNGAPVRESRQLLLHSELGGSRGKILIPVRTKEDGTFLVHGIPAGTYWLNTATSRYSYTPVKDIGIEAGMRTGPVVIEQSFFGLVAGRVVLTDEMKEARRVILSCYSPDDDLFRTFNLEVSTATGAFETIDMPPGHYTATLWIDRDGMDRARSGHREISFNVPEGGITDIVLEPVEE